MLPPRPAWSHDDHPSPTMRDTPEQQQQQRPQETKSRKPSSTTQETMDQPKKPRHRHSAFQLAALNELYDQDEHPSLEERTSLAERLGMETKTVNSWFQNKRASCKKRHKGASTATSPANAGAGSAATTNKKSNSSNSVELPPISALIASVSGRPGLGLGPSPPRQPEYDDYDEEEYRLPPTQQQLYYAGTPEQRDFDPPEQSQRPKARSRPSAAQTEELRKVYDGNPHPSKDQREELGRKIGMRYQSVTNWFQNQRSIAKKRKDEEDAHAAALAAHAASSSKSRMFSPFPPAAGTTHPSLSLAVPPATGHPSLAFSRPPQHSLSAPPLRARRSSSAVPLSRGHNLSLASSRSFSRPSSPRISPYRMPSDRLQGQSGVLERPQRPRRMRPEPYQLEALKKLFRRTATPSIEERGALALEIGMDVGKVTNWFRNLRQTARKRSAGFQHDGVLEDGELDAEEQDELMDVDADDISLATYQSRSATPMYSTGVSSSVSSPLMHALHPSHPPPPYSLEDTREEAPVPRYEARYTPPSPAQPPSEESLRQLYTFARAMRQRPASNEHSSSSDPDGYPDGDSHMGSEEDIQEAVTPSPESSPPPPPLAAPAVFSMGVEKVKDVNRTQVKVETGVKVEDALLLLSFHHHAMH